MNQKQNISDVEAQIRHILLKVWDPIGVSDEPNAQDKYDDYIGVICELLQRGASEAEICCALHTIETVTMGCLGQAKKSYKQ